MKSTFQAFFGYYSSRNSGDCEVKILEIVKKMKEIRSASQQVMEM